MKPKQYDEKVTIEEDLKNRKNGRSREFKKTDSALALTCNEKLPSIHELKNTDSRLSMSNTDNKELRINMHELKKTDSGISLSSVENTGNKSQSYRELQKTDSKISLTGNGARAKRAQELENIKLCINSFIEKQTQKVEYLQTQNKAQKKHFIIIACIVLFILITGTVLGFVLTNMRPIPEIDYSPIMKLENETDILKEKLEDQAGKIEAIVDESEATYQKMIVIARRAYMDDVYVAKDSVIFWVKITRVSDAMSYEDAVKFCEKHGAEIGQIRNTKEYDNIFETVLAAIPGSKSRTRIWTGLGYNPETKLTVPTSSFTYWAADAPLSDEFHKDTTNIFLYGNMDRDDPGNGMHVASPSVRLEGVLCQI